MPRRDDPQIALRQFAAGIAHDINNVLTAILGLAEKLESETQIEESTRQQIAVIAAQGRRLQRFSRGLAAFSRGTGERPLLDDDAPAAETLSRGLGTPAVAATEPPSRILLVDDDSAVRQIIAFQLEGMGYQVLQAASAAAALDLLDAEAEPLALALVDVVLPGSDGVELAAILRHRRPGLPIVMLSGTAPETEAEGEWLVKPVPLLDLRRTVVRCMQKAWE